ncbi:MAG TPA: TetR/AcrR family transcriptional regulator [Clostridia bacterium]|nr:TetR/AcrR family transcriptional regulator [Clostridia bacterium]
MPKDTFYNLPDEKKDRIEKVAIDEFSSKGYDQATISAIVKKARIAKGSFYQYFDNKEDLFKHIMDLIGREKIEFMSPILKNPEKHDFLTLIKEVYLSAVKFGANRPKLLFIASELNNNKSHPAYKDFVEEGKKKAIEIYSNLIELAINRGELREDIDVHFLAFTISSMGYNLNEYYFDFINKENLDYEDYSQKIIDLVDKQIDILEKGIAK